MTLVFKFPTNDLALKNLSLHDLSCKHMTIVPVEKAYQVYLRLCGMNQLCLLDSGTFVLCGNRQESVKLIHI